MNISIIIPTYNRLESVKKCLVSILKTDRNDFEIIIVNDASTDGTKEYLDNLKNPKIKIIHHTKNTGVSEALNDGIKMSQSEILAFTEDDCEAQDNWLDNLVQNFTDEKIGFVFGPTYYVDPKYRGYFPERVVCSLNWPGGGNIAYRKKVFKIAGYFDTFFEKYHNEDTEMAMRATTYGFDYKYEPTAVCHHQKDRWQIKSLLNSAKIASVWPILKKTYPNHYLVFNANSKTPIRFGIFISPKDYLYFFTLPIIIPLLLIRYLFHKKTDLKIFFAKWPGYLILKRFYIYKEAIRNRIFML